MTEAATDALSSQTSLELLAEFKYDRLLGNQPEIYSITLAGTIRGEQAIVKISRTAFANDSVELVLRDLKDTSILDVNDIYYRFLSKANFSQPDSQLLIIWPATEMHFQKYTPQKYHTILETPELYQQYTMNYIKKMRETKIQWVYNILNHEAEEDTIIFEDPDPESGFILLPNMKWDQKNVSALSLMAIVHRRDLHSLRDLKPKDIDYLQNVHDKIIKATSSKFSIEPQSIRLYLHYLPSYYHLHIHVLHVDFDAGSAMWAGRAHMLQDVIDQLKIMKAAKMDEGFASRSIQIVIGEKHELWESNFSKALNRFP